MIGIIYSFMAGIFISLQSIFNTRVGEKIGLFETTTVVHLVGLIVALASMILWGNGNMKKLNEVNKLYLLGGAFGVIILFCVMRSITLLGATYSVAILLVAQLIIATLIDSFGLFGTPQIKFDITKALGIIIMIGGIIVFKIKG